MYFVLKFENDDQVICKLVWDDGPKFQSLEDEGYISDRPISINCVMSDCVEID